MFAKTKILTTGITLISLIFFGQSLIAQTQTRRKKKETEETRWSRFSMDRLQLNEDQLQPQSQIAPELQAQPLEGAVDPQSYVVGAGDVFLINIESAEEISFRTQVTAEGKLIIPTVASLPVEGKRLSEVQSMVQKAGAEKYLDSIISANLILLRRIKVHVTGQVVYPGAYEALAVERVSNAIEKAGGLTSMGSERTIEVRHKDSTVDIIDMHRYFNLGELDANIYLRGGDVVYVPYINFSDATVRVEGSVQYSGVYQLVENETLENFLLRVGAYNRSADLSKAYVRRKSMTNGHSEEVPLFPFLEKPQNGQPQFQLQNKDVIMIPRREEKVYVVGAVRAPGAYDYYPNLQAAAYIGLAGSTERAAGLSRTRVIRAEKTMRLRDQGFVIKPGDTIFVPRRAEFGIREITTVIGTITSILLTMKAIDVL
ncbi:MAG: SLBB domain-containing protein [bacterium]